MINSHPSTEQLAAYANGSLADGMSLLIGSHMTYCPACRKSVEQFEALAGAVFQETPAEMTLPSLDKALALLDEPEVEEEILAEAGSPLPLPVQKELGVKLDDIRWKFRLPGVHEHVFTGFDGESVSLMRVRPGRTMPHHTHEGEEATLIFSGEMEDDGQSFKRGDVAMADHNHNHHPRVVGDEVCYCLIVLTGAMRFTGPVSRALNLLTR